MTFQVTAFALDGRQIANLGQFGNVPSARQAMLDHSNTINLPTDLPWHGPDVGVIEGWFIGQTEYNIEAGAAD